MPWHGGPGGGFTRPGVRPWLPMGDPTGCNVADQEGDPGSVLELCRRVVTDAGGQRGAGGRALPVARLTGEHLGLHPG